MILKKIYFFLPNEDKYNSLVLNTSNISQNEKVRFWYTM